MHAGQTERFLRERVADACRILYVEGHSDRTLGHVSARLPAGQAMIMKPSGLGLEEVRAQDMVVVDFDGKKLAGDLPRHGEYPVHGEVYRRHPDIHCVIHTHPPYTIWLGTIGRELVPLNHDGVLFLRAIPVFDETPDLILTSEIGRRMALRMGRPPVVLLKNHGVVIGGETVEEATLLALHRERAAQIFWMALSAGQTASAMSNEVADKMAADVLKNRKRLADLFEYHKRKADRVLRIVGDSGPAAPV